MTDARAFGTWCGVVAPIVALGAILAATVLAAPSTFTWSGRALSDMGRPGVATFLLFNGGLIVGGTIGLGFGYRLLEAARTGLQTVAAGVFGLAVLLLALVGVLHLPRTGHGAVAVGHYLAWTIAVALWGAGAASAGRRLEAVVHWILVVVHVAVWTVWVLAVAPAWFAIAEFLGALLFGGWSMAMAARLLWRSRSLPDGVRPETGP